MYTVLKDVRGLEVAGRKDQRLMKERPEGRGGAFWKLTEKATTYLLSSQHLSMPQVCLVISDYMSRELDSGQVPR
jgi:hypothetical protein